LKDEIKKMQTEMKQHKDDPKKVMKMQKKAMEKNMKYMMHSLKPTLFTFIPLIIIFSWLNTHMAFYPVQPGDVFTTEIEFYDAITGNVQLNVPEGFQISGDNPQEISENMVKWKVKAGETGEYSIFYDYKDDLEEKTYDTEIVVQEENGYKPAIKKIKDDIAKEVRLGYKKVEVLNIFGWKIGWLGSYIIFSIAFSMILRKLLKVY